MIKNGLVVIFFMFIAIQLFAHNANDSLQMADSSSHSWQNSYNENSMEVEILHSQINALNQRIENQKSISGNFKIIMMMLIILLVITSSGMIFFMLRYYKLAELIKKLPLQQLLEIIDNQKKIKN